VELGNLDQRGRRIARADLAFEGHAGFLKQRFRKF
jgi:hypothetical protein